MADRKSRKKRSYLLGGPGMRFQKGCIEINPIKDVPLLRQVLHCQLVTHEQLWRSCVWACTNSRGPRSTGVCADWSIAVYGNVISNFRTRSAMCTRWQIPAPMC